mmetsp:Transcript_26924/g.63238  ORF Transcript_26924/g.63238 Transcript_26924/m.63238 type:complete len:134 (-) Transcript_26924:78-479(-)
MYNSAHFTLFYLVEQDIETATIWVPPFDLLNRINGIQGLSDVKALVHTDGTVLWTLKGALKSHCLFKGLGAIPFDTLGCQIIFGPTEFSPDINYVLEDPNTINFGAYMPTYNEWTVIPEPADQGYSRDSTVIY